jgi:hypothetical protein
MTPDRHRLAVAVPTAHKFTVRFHTVLAFSVAHPSLLAQLAPQQQKASVILVMPATDLAQATKAASLMVQRAGVDDAVLLVVQDTDRHGFVSVANQCFQATQSDYFGYVAQDAFAGRRWLQRAKQLMDNSGKGLLGFNDGKWAGRLASFGLGRRSWLQANYPDGQLFCAQYSQHYADTELTALAMGNDQYCYDPNAVLMEVDWDKDHKAVNPTDKTLFAQRKTSWMPLRVQRPQFLEIFN